MQQIQITDIKLINLQATMNKDEVDFQPDNVQAMLQIHHDLKASQKSITYHITVGENIEDYLFVVECTYQFYCDYEDTPEEEIVKEVMRLLENRVEELLAFLSMEGGYLSNVKN